MGFTFTEVTDTDGWAEIVPKNLVTFLMDGSENTKALIPFSASKLKDRKLLALASDIKNSSTDEKSFNEFWDFINSSIESYQVKTLELFRQLDPNFKRIVNARAQVDALTREIPQQNYISSQNLELLQYLEQLNDESVQEIKIDLLTSSIDVLLDGLSSYKLQLIKELFTSESLIFSDDALVEKNNKIYGNLRVTYD